MSKVVVLFSEGNIPRIYKNPSEDKIDALRESGKVLINPRIPKGIPPHRWELDGKRIQIGASKENLSTVKEAVREVDIQTGPTFEDLHELEDNLVSNTNELLDKLNKMCIIGGLVGLLLLLVSLREEIQLLIKG